MRTYAYVTVYVDNTLLAYAKIVHSDGQDSFADEVFKHSRASRQANNIGTSLEHFSVTK